MIKLNEIGLKHHTDKASTHHCYLDVYESYLKHLCQKEFILLELGVASGASLKMWAEYFPKAKIYGIDTNPDCATYVPGVFIGSQSDTAFLDKLFSEIGIPDVIIDDASHHSPHTIASFKHLFPKMKNDGLYFVEDNHCFYDQQYGEAPPYGQGMSEVYKFFSGLDTHVDVNGRYMTGSRDMALNAPIDSPPIPEYSHVLDSIHIHQSLRLFKRR